MHIGIDARLLYYREGGIAAYTRHLVEALAALDTQTDYLVLHSRKDAHTLAPGANFRRANLWTPCHHRLERWALSAELLPLRLDLLHSPDFIPPQWGARRSVITVHDLNFLYYPQFLTAESRRYYNDQIARAVRQADHILADSEATKADLMRLLDTPPDKITVHPLGVEPRFKRLPEEDIEAARKTLGLPPEYILFVGTFEPRKNIPGLLEAYRYLRADLPDAPPLVLAGRQGWLTDDLTGLAHRLGLEACVQWQENPPPALMPALYNAASILVAPSFYEGFGLTVLEAMACGTPVVAADRSSLPEVAGEAAILVNPDDADSIADGLRRLLTDPVLWAEMSTAGLTRARQFTWQRTAEIVRQVYRQVAG